MERGPTFPWYKPVRGLAILLSDCVGCRGDFPLPAGQSPLSPIDLHLQLFLRESAYLSHSLPASLLLALAFPLFFLGDASRRRTVRFPVLFSPSPAPKVPSPVSTESRSRIPQDTEFAAHFIITLDGNKLSERRARARRHTRCFAYFYNAAHKSDKYAKSRFQYLCVCVCVCVCKICTARKIATK